MLKHLKHFFTPHEENNNRPGFFSPLATLFIITILGTTCGYYAFGVKIAITRDSFLAAVLPAILTFETNAERIKNNLSSVIMDDALSAAAQKKADDMAAKGYFAHVSPEGYTPWFWLEQAGYEYTFAGENLAANFEESSEVVRAWIASPGHHANLVKSEYTNMGIGIARGVLNGFETTFVVQLFATPITKPTPEVLLARVAPAVLSVSEVVPVVPAAPDTLAVIESEVVEKLPEVVPVIIKPIQNVALPTISLPREQTLAILPGNRPSVEGAATAQVPALVQEAVTRTIGGATSERQVKIEHKAKLLRILSQDTMTASFLDEILASPRALLFGVSLAVLLLTLILVALTMLLHMHIPHPDVVRGSLAVATVAIMLIFITQTGLTKTLVPTDTQSASVGSAF